eukprot:m.48647 g.48647  ORF g.48647 m.48647 type:complete len:123 (+) comp47765_c0_seq4:238-606(+)
MPPDKREFWPSDVKLSNGAQRDLQYFVGLDVQNALRGNQAVRSVIYCDVNKSHQLTPVVRKSLDYCKRNCLMPSAENALADQLWASSTKGTGASLTTSSARTNDAWFRCTADRFATSSNAMY